ncbi:hypothetical protein QTQ03_29470 [Micromonospora sp. WMMA1363]|uniref:hypothetical protein n=1 Tax=Micromonospora sp. WMMA1363 TaxID=3053985 RepID=UPI00259CCE61|nr:hypothetical protein [Micromonospora sp. WMMA1363]MDM4723509.1 hypothetical protein [Micromonospora sp. WMMA1363]
MDHDNGTGGPLARYSPEARVAVFIDFENLVCGAGKGLPGQSDPIPAKALTHLCRGFYGNASIRKAYADWANTGFGRHQPALASATTWPSRSTCSTRRSSSQLVRYEQVGRPGAGRSRRM